VADPKGTPARDIDKEIHELEERVDRLRVLYEQYFLGFEKLEPAVPRKEVDRRFAILRKDNIRNTALRYRFNVVWQKYNTYAMHWTRICRQIEEGTFKRHVKKAQERFGDAASAAAARRRAREEADAAGFDVDIDFEDLDSANMDDILAEADRAASKYERPPIDTVPPAVASAPPSAPTPAPRASPSSPIDRVARPAPLPAGKSGPKLVRKIVKGPESSPSSPPPDSAPTPPPNTSPTPAARPAPSPSGSIRGPMPSSPGGYRPAASSGRLPTVSPSGRIPAAPPPQSERPMPAPAPSERRLPGAPLSAPGIPQSSPRLPVSPPGAGPRPMIRPAIRPATQSKPDLGEVTDAPPKPAPSAPGPSASRPLRAPLPLPSQANRDEKK
jgi:hypothetical protein